MNNLLCNSRFATVAFAAVQQLQVRMLYVGRLQDGTRDQSLARVADYSMGRQKKFYQQPRAAKVLEQKFCTNYLSTSARLCSCDQVEAVLVW